MPAVPQAAGSQLFETARAEAPPEGAKEKEVKTALVTSTIHVPEVLRLYRACSEEVKFFIALDHKSPNKELSQFTGSDPMFSWLTPGWQSSQGYTCSDLIGWNTVERRNIATLEALKWGAEIIVSVDDDNIPMSTDYFDRYEMVLGTPFSGLTAIHNEWFDPGCLLHPYARHRGFPFLEETIPKFGFVVDAKVGVAAGLVIGDPDISAVDRISRRPIVQNVSQIAVNGITVNPSKGHSTVFNSQNIAFLRELAPCFLLCPQFGRFADIFASLVAQRVMRETDYVVHFGQPFVWQQRHPHNLIDDLKAEMWGMEHVLQFAEWLDQVDFPTTMQKRWGKGQASTVFMVRGIYSRMQDLPWMPAGVSELGAAWCDDVSKIL